MNATMTADSVTTLAAQTATAWLNAFLAVGQEETRPALYRTLSVEMFDGGTQFIGCDGTVLFRAWSPAKDSEADMPEAEEVPRRSVVVMDPDHFALAFMRTLASAAKGDGMEFMELGMAIEPAPEPEEALLGDAFSAEVLTLRAFGQQLHCRLYESTYPDWRALQFGIHRDEQVEGMKLATRMFATVGKIKGASAIDCTFLGEAKQIQIHAMDGPLTVVRGLLMPMRREKEKSEKIENDD